jgi:hypothetical protein
MANALRAARQHLPACHHAAAPQHNLRAAIAAQHAQRTFANLCLLPIISLPSNSYVPMAASSVSCLIVSLRIMLRLDSSFCVV